MKFLYFLTGLASTYLFDGCHGGLFSASHECHIFKALFNYWSLLFVIIGYLNIPLARFLTAFSCIKMIKDPSGSCHLLYLQLSVCRCVWVGVDWSDLGFLKDNLTLKVFFVGVCYLIALYTTRGTNKDWGIKNEFLSSVLQSFTPDSTVLWRRTN